jgi:RNA polymerase sigma-70 factor (ECF subfamily)
MRETAEFDAFYAATSHRLVGQLFAMTGDLGEAEDALQEAYIRAWQQWSKVGAYESPEGWVRSVAFKLCVNAWWKTRNRITAHRRAAPRSEAGAESELGPNLLALVQALRQLPERQRRVLVLHYVADLSVEQIAQEAGMPSGTVKSHLSRGRAALAPLVSEFCDDGTTPPGPGGAAGEPGAAGEQAAESEGNRSARKDYGYV